MSDVSVDQLSIEIKASADRASKSIDTLCNKLSTLSSSLSRLGGANLHGFNSSMNNLNRSISKMNGTAIADASSKLKGLASSLRSLDSVKASNAINNIPILARNIEQLNNALRGINTGNIDWINEFSKSINRLGKDSVRNAATNLPMLTQALEQMMQSLSNAPRVRQDIIDLTNALANLGNSRVAGGVQGVASSFNEVTFALNMVRTVYSKVKSILSKIMSVVKKVAGALKDMILHIRDAGKEAENGGNKFDKLASAFGKFYASCFLLVRAFKKLGEAIAKSMDYVETFNYFNVTMDKIGKDFGKQFARFGYDSAEAYASSFSGRLKTLLGKMTGYNIGSAGETFLSSGKNLGLDVNQLMNFQAKIGAITNSVGLLGESSINAGKALSMLSADLSSLTNTDLETVMTNLSSGLIGQSRALYKYGIDITNATLAQIALENGITKSVSAMTQAEKMQLRLLAILDQSKVAWGDQANTINSVANQYRILKQQVANLARTLGSLFLPILQKVLPFINGLVMAINKLLTFLGFKLWGDNWLKDIMDGISGGAGDAADDMEGLADSLDDVANSAKKMKGQLAGIDELNNLSSGSDGAGSGLGGGLVDLTDQIAAALADYEDVWNKAFEDMANKAQQWAERIEKAFLSFMDPILRAWDTTGMLIMIAWKSSLERIKLLISSIGRDLATMWHEEATVDVFGNIFNVIMNIVLQVGVLADKLRIAWDTNNNGLRMLQTIRDIILIITNKVSELSAFTTKYLRNIDFAPLFTSISYYMESLKPIFQAVYDVLGSFYKNVLLRLGEWVLEKGLPQLVDVFTNLNNNIDWERITSMFDLLWKYLEPFAQKVGQGLINFISETSQRLQEWLNNGGYEKLEEWLSTIENWMMHTKASDVTRILTDFLNVLIKVGSAIGKFAGAVIKLIGGNSLGDLYDRLVLVKNSLKLFVEALLRCISPIYVIVMAIKDIININKLLMDSLKGFLIDKIFKEKFGASEKSAISFKDIINELFDAFSPSKWAERLSSWINTLKDFFGKAKEEIQGIGDKIKEGVSGFAGKITNNGANPVQIPQYATGGFPEDGFFYANHNELVGRFSNGKTMVANNNQIISGIADGVAYAISGSVSPYLQRIVEINNEIASKDIEVSSDGIFRNVRNSAYSFSRRTGKDAFSF